ncbi:MAG: DUF6449 domain-containing protein [Lachnospiraceae bacterium]|nr:DUF6449 domain-containing protein [Lachnospiraceae bacterium]
MTSRTSLINYIKGDVRRKSWMYVSFMVILFFSMPFNVISQLYMYRDELNVSVYDRMIMERTLATILKSAYGTAVVWAAIAGTAWGMLTFFYLYSRSRVDLIHSLPITRVRLFRAKIWTDFLIFAVISLAAYASVVIVYAVNGHMTPDHFIYSVRSYLVGLAAYALMNVITVIAVMLTGTVFMGVAAIIFLFTFAFPIRVMADSLGAVFYETYFCMPDSTINAFNKLIPYDIIACLNRDGGTGLWIYTVVLTVALYFIAKMLYIKRPSEGAGISILHRPVAVVTSSILTIEAALLGALYSAYLFDLDRWGGIWCWILMLLFALLAHMLLQMVIEQDARAFLKNKGQFAVCIAITVMILLGMRWDVFGFDRYIPKAEDVEFATITQEYVDGSIQQYEKVDSDNSLHYISWDNDFYSNYTYVSNYEYNYDNMRFREENEIKSIISIAQKGIDNPAADSDSRGFLPYIIRDYGYNDELYYNETVICYHLNSGREVVRSYHIDDSTDLLPELSVIYGSDTYRDAKYQAKEFYEAGYIDSIEIVDERYETVARVEGKSVEELLDAYMEDVKTYPLAKMEGNLPRVFMRSYSDNGADCMDGYYIYPYYQKTLQCLSECGIVISNERVDEVERIEVYDYEDGEGHALTRPADNELMDEIIECAIPEVMTYGARYFFKSEDSFYMDFYNKYDADFNCVSYVIPKGRVPEKLAAMLAED